MAEREKTLGLKERNMKLLQEQLEDLEERNRLLEKAKKKMEIDMGVHKVNREKMEEKQRAQEEEMRKGQEEVSRLIRERCEMEQQWHNTKAMLGKVEGMLRDRSEFQKLDELVG